MFIFQFHLTLLPGRALSTLSTICIVTGNEATAVNIPLECRFVTQSLRSSCLCWCPQEAALSTAFITEKLFRFASLRYTLATWTKTVIRSCVWWNKVVILPVKATEPFPERVGITQDSVTSSPTEASQIVHTEKKMARICTKIPAIWISVFFAVGLQHAVGIIGWAWRTIAALAFSTLFLVEAIETIKNNALIAANYDMMKKQTKNWKTTNLLSLQTCDFAVNDPFCILAKWFFQVILRFSNTTRKRIRSLDGPQKD